MVLTRRCRGGRGDPFKVHYGGVVMACLSRVGEVGSELTRWNQNAGRGEVDENLDQLEIPQQMRPNRQKHGARRRVRDISNSNLTALFWVWLGYLTR